MLQALFLPHLLLKKLYLLGRRSPRYLLQLQYKNIVKNTLLYYTSSPPDYSSFECRTNPHRYSRVNSLKKEFASSFILSDLVLLCPIYSAGEKKDKLYSQNNFAKLINKYSKVQVVNIQNEIEMKKYFKKNLIKDEIVIGMGAGSISKWIRNLENKL